MTGVAVNVTDPPAQIELVLAAIATDGVTDVAVIVIGLLVAVAGLTQGSLLVMITVTISPFTRVVVVNILLLVPLLTPLICH